MFSGSGLSLVLSFGFSGWGEFFGIYILKIILLITLQLNSDT